MAKAARLLLSVTGALAAGMLAVFHSWLLWHRLSNLAILQPVVALRWLGALILLGTLLWLRARGAPILRGRRSAVLWFLVLLLHWNAPPHSDLDWAAPPAEAVPAQEVVVLSAALTGLTLVRRALPRIDAGRALSTPRLVALPAAASALAPGPRLERVLVPTVWSRPPPSFV